MTGADTVASLDRTTRRFGPTVALDDVSLSVEAGQLVGLLGPNGSGKTTMLSLLQGLRRPSSGTVRIFGGDPRDAASRRFLGCTPQETALPPTLRVGEVLDFVGRHFDRPVPPGELAEEFGFADLLRRQCGALSGGQRRRVAVGLAFAGRPRLVLLDEPTTGLDVDARAALWEALRRRHAEGAAIVVTSHYLEEIEALARRVVVIAEGRILADDAIESVLGRVGARMVRLASPEPERVAALPGVRHVDSGEDGELAVAVADSDDFVRALVTESIPFSGLAVRGASLEEAFRSLTTGPAGPERRAA